MYDVYLQRRAVLNEMREMAARPFAQVQLNTQDSPLLDEQPQPVRNSAPDLIHCSDTETVPIFTAIFKRFFSCILLTNSV